MRRKWIVAGAASLAAVAGAAMMATTVFGGGAEPRAASLRSIWSSRRRQRTSGPRGEEADGRLSRPGRRHVVDSDRSRADSSTCASGPCPRNTRVIEGGIGATDNFDVFVQGSYIDDNRRDYHVLIADVDEPGPFTLDSNLTCLKGRSQG